MLSQRPIQMGFSSNALPRKASSSCPVSVEAGWDGESAAVKVSFCIVVAGSAPSARPEGDTPCGPIRWGFIDPLCLTAPELVLASAAWSSEASVSRDTYSGLLSAPINNRRCSYVVVTEKIAAYRLHWKMNDFS